MCAFSSVIILVGAAIVACLIGDKLYRLVMRIINGPDC
jgi:hypothetical protein